MTGKRLLRIAGVLLAFVALQGLLVYVYLKVERSWNSSPEAAFRIERLSGGPGPDLVFFVPDGSSRRLSDFRGGIVLLHFWATWCPPCREELPGLLDLGRELSVDGRLSVVAVSLDTDWTAVREYFGGDIPPEIVRMGLLSAARAYGVSTLPDTYLLASDGSFSIRFGGLRDWRAKPARDALLKEINGSEHE